MQARRVCCVSCCHGRRIHGLSGAQLSEVQAKEVLAKKALHLINPKHAGPRAFLAAREAERQRAHTAETALKVDPQAQP